MNNTLAPLKKVRIKTYRSIQLYRMVGETGHSGDLDVGESIILQVIL
jgi:hypothetical protein